jgi:hypothetical protein
MKNTFFLLVVITLLFNSCKQQKLEYLYSDKDDLIACSSGGDMELIKEAVYTFEDYISKHYTFIGNTVAEGYNNYLKLLINNRPPAKEFFNDHLKDLVAVLKNEKDLWTINGTSIRLNYNNELVNCIIQNIQDKEMNTTIEVLSSSGTLTPEVLAPALYNKRLLMAKDDRALATYVTLDMFYTKLIQMSDPDYVEVQKENRLNRDADPKNLKKVGIIKNPKQDNLKQ